MSKKTKPLTVHLPAQDWERIAELAESRGVSRSSVVQTFMRGKADGVIVRVADSVNAILFGLGVLFGALLTVLAIGGQG